MVKTIVYSTKGAKLSEISLPKKFTNKVNMKLVAQAVRVYEERSHIGLAKAKTRAEINRTKKKWYKQKGTGGARHGAKSAPIFVGGGVAHGPRPLRRELTLPKKMLEKALESALSLKLKEKEIIIIDGLSKISKTKDARVLLEKLKIAENKKITFVVNSDAVGAKRAIRNLKNGRAVDYKQLNAFGVMNGGILVFDRLLFVSDTKKKEGV